jgi:hypothetical protein
MIRHLLPTLNHTDEPSLHRYPSWCGLSDWHRLTLPDPLPVKPLLAHAQALATHSSAPVSSLLTPLDRANALPWPTEAAMRQGLLFALQGSMSGVGDVGKIGDGELACTLTRRRRQG